MSTRDELEQRLDAEIRATLAPRLAAALSRQEKTREAATVLFFGHGIYPSAKTVHRYTQHGSLTDINADLRAFWRDLREKGRVRLDTPTLPAEVTELFSDGLAKLWELAMDKAQAALEAEREDAAEQVAQAQREAAEAERLRRLVESDAEASEMELRQERERRERAEQRAEAQAAELDALQAALTQWQAQAEAEAKARQAAEERFSGDLAAERAARQRDTDMFDGEIQFAKLQIEAARSEGRELREQLRAEKASKELDLASYRQRASRAEAVLSETRQALAELSGRHEALEQRLAELQGRLKALAKGGHRVSVSAPATRRTGRR